MPAPTTVGALRELVHVANCMRFSVTWLSGLICLSKKDLEEQYKLYKTRGNAKLSSRLISAWGDSEDTTFCYLVSAISNQVKLTLPDTSKRLCLFNDVSSTHWAVVLTQVLRPEVDLCTSLPLECEHEPLSFVSGYYKDSSLRWSASEPEGYALILSVTRLSHFLAASDETTLFTVHKNILQMISPKRFDINVTRHIVHKTQRWAEGLAEFNFTVQHIPGESNSCADMFTRWADAEQYSYPAFYFSSLCVQRITGDVRDLLSFEIVAFFQHKNAPPADSEFTVKQMDGLGFWANGDGQLYLSLNDNCLQMRICAAAHCGIVGHRGSTATKSIIREIAT